MIHHVALGRKQMKRVATLMVSVLIVAMMSFVATAASQDNSATSRVVSAVRAYRVAHEPQIISEFVSLLSIPNVASDTPNIQRNATALVEMLKRRGFRTELLPIPGRGPVVFGDLESPGAKGTVIFYCHYDGQPVEANKWIGTKPFVPALRTDTIDAGGHLIPFPEQPGAYKTAGAFTRARRRTIKHQSLLCLPQSMHCVPTTFPLP